MVMAQLLSHLFHGGACETYHIFITQFSVSIKEKEKTKTAVSDAEVGEMEAQAVIMHGDGSSTVQANFLKKPSSRCYTVLIGNLCAF
jgi:hypothetical protein